MKKNLIPGQLVQSIAGRDSNKYFLVIESGEGIVKVADGKMRKVQAPKKKNVKHLRKYNLVAREIAQKLNAGKRVTNEEVSKAIENLVAGLED